jgi:curved DNA-binding protein CbpA
MPDSELRVGEVDPTTLPLQPQEFYVFSLMTKEMTLAQLKTRCIGLGDVEGSVARLIELGALTSPDVPVEGSRDATLEEREEEAPPPSSEVPADEAGVADVAPQADDAHTDGREAEAVRAEPLRSDAHRGRVVEALPEPTGLPEVAPVTADDPRLEQGIALDIEFQRTVLAAVELGENLNAFRVLGIGPTEDVRRIKRAFHALSRKLHPDAYFGQDLGDYSRHLERLFTLAKSSFTTLKDPSQRDAIMSSWFEEESQKCEEVLAEKRNSEEFELARQKASTLRRSKRNKERSLQRARKRATTNVEHREHHIEALRAQALKEFEAGRPGEALASLHNAKGMLRPGSELRLQIEADEQKMKKARSKEAYSRAVKARKENRSKEAAALFDEAARLAPSLEYLSEAAISMADHNSAQAREHAMAALSELGRREKEGGSSAALAGRANYAAAIAFRAAGLRTSARSAARQAEKYLGDTPAIRKLLKSLSIP